MVVTHFDDRMAPPRTAPGWRAKRLLLLWLVTTVLWLGIVVAGFCGKVNEQIDSTRAIGRELQAMDCASATGKGCAQAGLADYEGSWTGVATLFATFGFWHIFPLLVLPPAALFVFGCAACGCSRAFRKHR
jgi:hypothetical protein